MMNRDKMNKRTNNRRRSARVGAVIISLLMILALLPVMPASAKDEVTFILEGCGADVMAQTSISGSYSNMGPVTPPTRQRYDFDGYYTGRNGTGEKVFGASGAYSMPTGISESYVTLYANWNRHYTVLVWSYNPSTIQNSHKLALKVNEAYTNSISREYLNGAACTVVNQTVDASGNPRRVHFTKGEDLSALYDMVVVMLPSTDGLSVGADKVLNDDDVSVLARYIDRGGRILIQGEVGDWVTTNQNQICQNLVERLGGNFHIAAGDETNASIAESATGVVNPYSTIMGGKPLSRGYITIGFWAQINLENSTAEWVAAAKPKAQASNVNAVVDQAIGNGRVTVMSDFNWWAGNGADCAKLAALPEDEKYAAYEILCRMLMNSADNLELVRNGGNPNEGFGKDHHWYDFALDGNTLTAKCSDTDCTLQGGKITLTLFAEDQFTGGMQGFKYTGAALSTNRTNFVTFTQSSLSDIMYKAEGAADSTRTTTAPTSTGSYEASVDVTTGGVKYTLRKTFLIGENGFTTSHTSSSITVLNAGDRFFALCKDGSIVKEYTDKKDASGNIVFTGLEPDTSYKVRMKTGDNSYIELDARTSIDPMKSPASYTASAKSITFNNLDAKYMYALKTVNPDGTAGEFAKTYVTPSDGTVTFTDLNEETSYYLVACSNTNLDSDTYKVKTLKHTHKWVYSVEKDTLTAECTSTKPCECESIDESLTVRAEPSQTDAAKVKITVSASWKKWLGDVTIDSVVYKRTDSKSEETTSVPTEAGCYKATVQLSNGYSLRTYFDIDDSGKTADYTGDEDYEIPYQSESIIAYSDGYIHYDASEEHVLVYASEMIGENFDEFGDEQRDIYIDLTTETFESSFGFGYYSLDGGKKWTKASSINQKTLKKFFTKDINLRLTDKLDAKKKHPAEDAAVYGFATIRKRPKAPALKIDYNVARDDYGITNGQWMLVNWDYNLCEDLDRYELRVTDDAGAAFSSNNTDVPEGTRGSLFENYASFKETFGVDAWGRWPSDGGVWVPGTDSRGRTRKAKIELRAAAAYNEETGEYTAAGKVKKLTVTSITKAPSIKVNYTKEEIRLKKGMSMYFGTADSIQVGANGIPNFNVFPEEKEPKEYNDYAGSAIINTTELAVRSPLSISPYLTEERNTILLWQTAVRRKPASACQTIKLEARYVINEDNMPPVTVSNGKAKIPDKFEILVNGKWTKSVPTVTEDKIFEIHHKTDAKGGKETKDGTTFAASNSAYVALFYGEVMKGSLSRPGVEFAEVYLTREEAEAAIEEWKAGKTDE